MYSGLTKLCNTAELLEVLDVCFCAVRGFWCHELPASSVFRYCWAPSKLLVCFEGAVAPGFAGCIVNAVSKALLLDRHYACLPKEVRQWLSQLANGQSVCLDSWLHSGQTILWSAWPIGLMHCRVPKKAFGSSLVLESLFILQCCSKWHFAWAVYCGDCMCLGLNSSEHVWSACIAKLTFWKCEWGLCCH